MTPSPDQQKRQILRRHGTLNPRPEDVTDPQFQNSEFFDPEDLLQVKYEMVRQVEVEKKSVSESTKRFGFSRPSFYQAQSALQREGVAGLIPRKRGPREGHKLTDEVMEFVVKQHAQDASLTPEQLAQAVEKKFRLRVHPRSIKRQLQRKKKLRE